MKRKKIERKVIDRDEEEDFGLKEKLLDIMEEDNRIDFVKVTQIMTMLTAIRTACR